VGAGDVSRRLSICYAAPGHRLVPTAGPTRNMLALAEALGAVADVTLAFRHVPAGFDAGRRVLAIEADGADAGSAADDVAHRGLSPLAHLAYLRRLSRFARACGETFDVVMEKGWRLSGALAGAFARHGVPGVLVENDVRSWSEGLGSARALVKLGAHLAAGAVVRHHRRRLPIIAETDELREMLIRRGAPMDRVEVIGLGVDHRLFRPREQGEARRALGIDVEALVLVYVGAMDTYHDLTPLLQAMPAAPAGLELHVVGDGTGRAESERRAAEHGSRVWFHGRVPHPSVPQFIAAADACVVAYRERAFPGGAVPFSTLKVPEYMACGRAVVGNAAGQARALLEQSISAVLFPNDVGSWRDFLAGVPPREALAEMGRAAAKAAEALSWERTAARYLEVCERAVAARGRR
jgi:glycosyltransferase involved in cell wall biosynthesis